MVREQTGRAPSGTSPPGPFSWGNGCAFVFQSQHTEPGQGQLEARFPSPASVCPFLLRPPSLGFIGNYARLMVPVPLDPRSHWLPEATWCQEFFLFSLLPQRT